MLSITIEQTNGGKKRKGKKEKPFWQRAHSAEKFQESGLWGLKLATGEIVLEPKYDQIEFCADFIYAHYEGRHTFFYKNGGSSDRSDCDDDYLFYENGMIGLKNSDGSIFLPAVYDEIIDWGVDCDVVYVRKGSEFHYFNHNHDEILTDVDIIPEDRWPLCPFNLGEDQNREVLLCIEPIEKETCNRDCFAYGQWVRLSRIPYKSIREIFADCKVVEMPQNAIEHFEHKHTYIYSARTCTASGEMPLTTCIEKFKTLGCYDSSWEFLLKISTNSRTKINPHDLYNVVKHFENNDLETGFSGCIDYDIAVDIDETLADGEVRVFQVHFFWDDMGEFLFDDSKMNTLPNGTIDEVRSALDALSPEDRGDLLEDAFWWVKYSENRSWEATKQVLEYLKEQGCDTFTSLITRHLDINFFGMEDITPTEWKFKKEIISWAISNGGELNIIKDGKTLYEKFVDDIEKARVISDKDNTDALESIRNAERLAEWLKSKGAITAAEQHSKIDATLDGLSPKEVLELVL